MKRRRPGQSMVELVCGLFILIPLVLVLFDLAVIVIAVQVNDQTCRQAARAAASGDPNSANARAQAVVARANQQGSSMMSNYTLSALVFNPASLPAQATALQYSNGGFGGTLTGTVSVDTTVDVKPFIVPYVYSGGAPLTFRSSQTYPFSYVVPNGAP